MQLLHQQQINNKTNSFQKDGPGLFDSNENDFSFSLDKKPYIDKKNNNHNHRFGDIQLYPELPIAVQAKLEINTPGDEYEQEADAVADKVMRMARPGFIQRKCAKCEEEEKKNGLQRKESGNTIPEISFAVNQTLLSPGQPLDNSTQTFMQEGFGFDFSKVRIHNDPIAHQSAKDINALAYTHQYDIVFGEGQYQPQTEQGKRLLAHELAHVQQQQPGLLQRCVYPKKNDPWYDAVVKLIKATPAYAALSPDDKILADGIIVEAKKKAGCIWYIGELQKLFTKKEKPPAAISTKTKASTVTEAAKEQVRITKPAEAKNTGIEKAAADDPARVWTGVKGKFGGGTYFVDKSNPKNIVVKAKIFLRTAGTGTQTDIDGIKAMQDAIEKFASTKGYIVSIEFVNNASDPNTFTVDVDPSKWETATNWSGGDPWGFAHELHHMFAFELDRYNYIEAHADNDSMVIHDRLYWFTQELKKPADYNNPTSIVSRAQHPDNDDVCTVAQLDKATCIAARQKL